MKNKNKIFVAFLTLVFSVPVSFGQQDIAAAGGEANGPDGSTSFTVGQVNYETYTAATGESVSAGVQQAYEILSVGFVELASNDYELSVYPNPTIDYLMLKGKSTIDQDLNYSLCDASGKVLETLSISDDMTAIEMSQYSPATYILNVTKNGTTIKSFKIIKNH